MIKSWQFTSLCPLFSNFFPGMKLDRIPRRLNLLRKYSPCYQTAPGFLKVYLLQWAKCKYTFFLCVQLG